MDIELKKEMVSINETVMCDSTQILVQSDIIVPDIKSDMAKILQIDSQAMVEEIVISDKRADISGMLALTILYVPEGDTKPVCSIITSLPFSTVVENSQISIGSKCICSADAYHIEFSMLNSRKLSVKAVVELDIRCIRENTLPLVCDINSDESVEKNMQSFEIYNLVHASHTKLGIRETLDFPPGKPSALSVLKTDAKICDKDVRLISGKIIIKGSIGLCSLYVSDTGTLEFMEHEIPFTEVIDAENANENSMCELDMDICHVDFSPRADTDGDVRLLDVEILIDASASITQNTNMSAISDCFCASHKLVCKTDCFSFDVLAGCGKAQEALRTILAMDENEPELLSVYNLITKPYISDVKAMENKAIISGVIDCYLLYLSASPVMPISTKKAQIEFEIPVEILGMSADCDCDVGIEIAHQSYNITMTGEVEVRVSVIIDAKALGKMSAQLISDVQFDEQEPVDMRHGIIIYFVRPGDTLWKIAKKYNVPLELILKINGIENPDMLDVGQRLIIPNTTK